MGVDQVSTRDIVDPGVVGDIPMNNATVMVSDGTDDFTDGDVVLLGNWNGTPIAAVIGNLSSETGLVSVDTSVSGDLGGLL